MKTLKLNEDFELDFLILGINSHTKLYKLCWEINKELHTDFVKNKNHTINNNQEFERFSYRDKNSGNRYNILSNIHFFSIVSLSKLQYEKKKTNREFIVDFFHYTILLSDTGNSDIFWFLGILLSIWLRLSIGYNN